MVAVAVALAACGRVGFAPVPVALSDDANSDGIDGTPNGPAAVPIQAAPLSVVSTNLVQTTFPSAVTPGHMIVVYVWAFSQGPAPLPTNGAADNAGTAYQQATNIVVANCTTAAGYAAAAIYYGVATSASAPTVTLTPGANPSTELGMMAMEYANVTMLVDATRKETAGTATPIVFDSGDVTTLRNGLLASVGTGCAGYPSPITWSDTQSFTARGAATTTLNLPPGIAADKVVDAAGTYRDAWSVGYVSGAPNPVLGVIAAFE